MLLKQRAVVLYSVPSGHSNPTYARRYCRLVGKVALALWKHVAEISTLGR